VPDFKLRREHPDIALVIGPKALGSSIEGVASPFVMPPDIKGVACTTIVARTADLSASLDNRVGTVISALATSLS